jgi:hypothetical protein
MTKQQEAKVILLSQRYGVYAPSKQANESMEAVRTDAKYFEQG